MNLLYLNQNTIALLAYTKDLFQQIKTDFFEKKYTTPLLKDFEIYNTDIIASAVKESLNSVFLNKKKSNKFLVFLPNPPIEIIRTQLPSEMNKKAADIFIQTKVRTTLSTDDYEFSYSTFEFDNKKEAIIYAIRKSFLIKLNSAFSIIETKLEGIIPESLAIFNLFKETLSKTKREYIWYINATKRDNHLFVENYFYDNLGPLRENKIETEVKDLEELKKFIKKTKEDFNKKGIEFHRLILGGEISLEVRQDLLTKEIGIWVNPLHKIVEVKHSEKLKSFINFNHLDSKFWHYLPQISYLLSPIEAITPSSDLKIPAQSLTTTIPVQKEPRNYRPIINFLLTFIASFILALGLIIGINKFTAAKNNSGSLFPNFLAKKPTPTPTPTNTPTPTPEITVDKEKLKIKILNGSGIRGQAGKLKSYLLDKGYQDIVTGNADSFDYEQTEILYREEAVLKTIQADLKELTSGPKIKNLPEGENSDVIIIIGKDLELQ